MRELARRWDPRILCVHVQDPDDALIDALEISSVPVWMRFVPAGTADGRGSVPSTGARSADEECARAVASAELTSLLDAQQGLEVMVPPQRFAAAIRSEDPRAKDGERAGQGPGAGAERDPHNGRRTLMTDALRATGALAWVLADRATGARPKHEIHGRFSQL